jgi:hypothetical protein
MKSEKISTVEKINNHFPDIRKIVKMPALIIKILSIITFLSASVTVAGISYEGLVLEWFSYVGISILITDVFFLIATIVGVFYYKRNRILFYSHLFSTFVISVGIILTLTLGEDIPKILFLCWEFYILYFYGIIVCRKLWQNIAADASDNAADVSDIAADASDNGADASDNGADASDNGADVSDNGADASDNAADVSDNAADASDNARESGTEKINQKH